MYKQEFPDIPIGYSGHELGSAISVAAVALGAQVSQETCRSYGWLECKQLYNAGSSMRSSQ
jgi:hypothetical protein